MDNFIKNHTKIFALTWNMVELKKAILLEDSLLPLF